MWTDMKRKNRIRGRKAHRTAILNRALKALKEKNDLPSSEILEKLKLEKLGFSLTSLDPKEFSLIQSYQDELRKYEDLCAKCHDSDMCSNNVSFQEKCVAPQIKTENGFHIKVEMTDETTEEGYDGDLKSDGELEDPLKYMSFKLEPPDDVPSPESTLSYSSINTVPDSYLPESENNKEAYKLLSSNNLSFQVEDNYNNVPDICGMKIEPVNETSFAAFKTKQQLKDVKSEVSEVNRKSSNNFTNFDSVYRIIKDTDSSLTCKFVKSEILKEDIDHVGKNCSRSNETKHLEQEQNCIKSEMCVEEYESDTTLPVDDDEVHTNENIDDKEENSATEKKAAYINPLHDGVFEGFGDSNSSSVLSTVEGDFTPYEDYTLVQVNEEALMKRLVFSDPAEEEIFESESDKADSKPIKEEISSVFPGTGETDTGKQTDETAISEQDINIECKKRKFSELESLNSKESSEENIPVSEFEAKTVTVKNRCKILASSVTETNILPKLNVTDSEASPNVKADILTKELLINVERIDYTEKSTSSQTKSLKDTSHPEVETSGSEKESSEVSRSERKRKKEKKRNPKGKSKHNITRPKKPHSEVADLKKQKSTINELKKQPEVTKPKKLKLKIAVNEVKKPNLKIVKYEKQKSVEDEQLSAPLYVRPKRRKLSFQEKLDEPQLSVWDSELLPDPSVLSTVGIRKIKQIKVKKKKNLGLKPKDSTNKELTASVASAKQRLAKNLSLLSAPVQKFTVAKPEVKCDVKEPKKALVKNDIKELEKCKNEETSDDSVNELEQIIDALSAKDEIKSPDNCLLDKKKCNELEEIEIKLEDHNSVQKESVSVPVINDALLEEILTTGFINMNTQIYIEPVKPKYRVVTAPPPFPKPSVPFNLDYLVARIGGWNVAWLEEQTINLNPPPDIAMYARNPILSYICYDEYFDVYYPFLMLEIWQFMFESWQKRIYSSENIIIASVISHEIEDDVLILQCKVTMNDQIPILDFPFEGHLVILNLNLHGCESQAQIFGYVTDHRVEQTLPTDTSRPSDDMSNNNPISIFLTIKTKVRMGCPDFEKVIMIEHLCLLKSYVLEFEALVNLHKNELVCNILRPQEISYLSKQEKPFLSLGNYSAEQQNSILDLSQLINSPEPNVSFVSGAPGSGKTHTLVGLVQQLLCEDGNSHNVKLLVTSQTHSGVNDIGCRLVKLQHLFKRNNKRELRLVRVGSFECTHPGLQAHCIDNLVKYNLERNKQELSDTEMRFLAIENDIAKLKNLLMNCRPHSDEIHSAQRKVDKLLLERRQLLKKLNYLKNKTSIDEEVCKASMRLEILENADVILTTVRECRSSVLVSAYSGSSCRFKCCIVDDATQLNELQLLTLLLYDTQKLVLFGDTQQLIPKVKSIASRDNGYQLSYFERCQLYFQILSDVPPCNYCVLREQFRMHSDISYFSSSYFYGDKVITPPNIDKNQSFPRLHSCVVFDITDGVQSMDKLNIYNLPEAQFVVKIISELSKFIKCKWNVGIIVSCWGQCDILQKLLTNDVKMKHDVEVGTVDYFQGHEKDVIIVSCVQTKRREGENLLSCPQLFNLAITRAHKLLIICGSAGLLQQWTHWKMFLRYIIRKKTFFRTKSTASNVMLHLTNSGHN